MHHHPSLANFSGLRHFGLRNTLWNSWLHRPVASASRWTLFILRSSPKDRDLVRGLWLTVRGVPWVLRRRRPMTADLDAGVRVLEERRFAGWAEGRRTGRPVGTWAPSPSHEG
jgi:hypothetical protein